jgi:hypothetical protein
MTGLLTGHCHLKGHLFKLGLVSSPECDRWKQASEWPHTFFVTVTICPNWNSGTWVVIIWNQVTLKTSLSARYCTLIKVQDCWMNELQGAQNIDNGRSSRVTVVPALPCSVLFCSILSCRCAVPRLLESPVLSPAEVMDFRLLCLLCVISWSPVQRRPTG